MNRKLLIACCAALLITGCAVQKEWSVVNGSRADGTVALAYDYGLFQNPQADMAQGGQVAVQACQNWGYANASPFTPMQNCLQVNGYGSCILWRVVLNYQCTGQPEARSVVVVPPAPAATPGTQPQPPHPQDVHAL